MVCSWWHRLGSHRGRVCIKFIEPQESDCYQNEPRVSSFSVRFAIFGQPNRRTRVYTMHFDRDRTDFKLPESNKETEHASRQLQVMLSDLFQFHLSGEQVRRIATKQYGVSLSKSKKFLDMLQVQGQLHERQTLNHNNISTHLTLHHHCDSFKFAGSTSPSSMVPLRWSCAWVHSL